MPLKIIRVERAKAPTGEEEEGKLYFQVYKSPKDGRVLGSTTGSWVSGEKEATFLKPDRAPVAEAWERAKALAASHGTSEILVYDPENLFPATT